VRKSLTLKDLRVNDGRVEAFGEAWMSSRVDMEDQGLPYPGGAVLGGGASAG
jgi:hypothetical protein